MRSLREREGGSPKLTLGSSFSPFSRPFIARSLYSTLHSSLPLTTFPSLLLIVHLLGSARPPPSLVCLKRVGTQTSSRRSHEIARPSRGGRSRRRYPASVGIVRCSLLPSPLTAVPSLTLIPLARRITKSYRQAIITSKRLIDSSSSLSSSLGAGSGFGAGKGVRDELLSSSLGPGGGSGMGGKKGLKGMGGKGEGESCVILSLSPTQDPSWFC